MRTEHLSPEDKENMTIHPPLTARVKKECGHTTTPGMPSNRAYGQLYLIFPEAELKDDLCNGAAVCLLAGRK